MGADKTVYLTQKITNEELEQIFDVLKMKYSRQFWGYSSELDVSLFKNELHFHYAYWGIDHARNAHRRTRQIIRELRKKGLIKKIGKWGY